MADEGLAIRAEGEGLGVRVFRVLKVPGSTITLLVILVILFWCRQVIVNIMIVCQGEIPRYKMKPTSNERLGPGVSDERSEVSTPGAELSRKNSEIGEQFEDDQSGVEEEDGFVESFRHECCTIFNGNVLNPMQARHANYHSSSICNMTVRVLFLTL